MKRYYKGNIPTCNSKVYDLMVGTLQNQLTDDLTNSIVFKIKHGVDESNPLLSGFTKISKKKAQELSREWGQQL